MLFRLALEYKTDRFFGDENQQQVMIALNYIASS